MWSRIPQAFTCGKGLVFWFLSTEIPPPQAVISLSWGAEPSSSSWGLQPFEASIFFRMLSANILPCGGLSTRPYLGMDLFPSMNDGKETATKIERHSKLGKLQAWRLCGSIKNDKLKEQQESQVTGAEGVRERAGGREVIQGSLPAPEQSAECAAS